MIERIRREHTYMLRLLALLKRKVEQLKIEQPINYSLVWEVVDYLSTHSDRVHHPKEDILYRHYLTHYGEQETMEDLETEHITLSASSKEFLSTIDMILQDAVVPQHIFLEQLETFIAEQRRHLELEEREILPLIVAAFTTSDWQHVETLWDENEDDPVFGDTIADRYRQLAQYVRQTEEESL